MLNVDDRLIKEVLPRIGPNAFAVLMAIAVHMDATGKDSFPSNKRLTALTGIGRDGLYAAFAVLKKHRLFSVEQEKAQRGKFGKRTIFITTDLIAFWVPAKSAPFTVGPHTDEEIPEPFTPEPCAVEPCTANPAHNTLNNKELINNKEQYCAEENPHPIYQVEVFEPVKTETVTVEQPRVKVLMPKYDLKKHPLPELEAQRKKLLEQYNDPNTPIHNREAIEATGKKVAALIKTEKDIDAAILLLNEKAGFTYRLNTPATRKAIKNRLSEYPLGNLALVIEHKCKEWADDEKMRQYLRPETLFNGHFESYYQAALIAKKPSKKQNETVYTAPVKRFGQ